MNFGTLLLVLGIGTAGIAYYVSGSQPVRPIGDGPVSESWSPSHNYGESVDPYKNLADWRASAGEGHFPNRPWESAAPANGSLQELYNRMLKTYEEYVRSAKEGTYNSQVETYNRYVAAKNAYDNAAQRMRGN